MMVGNRKWKVGKQKKNWLEPVLFLRNTHYVLRELLAIFFLRHNFFTIIEAAVGANGVG